VSITGRSQVYEDIYLNQVEDTMLTSVEQHLATLVGLYETSLYLLASSRDLLSFITAGRG
jgi:hypothetical protein